MVPALLAFVLYLPTRTFGFVWDDLDLIRDNRLMHAGDWSRLLMSDYWASTGGGSGMWRPAVTISFALEGAASGFTPALFHLVNAGWHAVSTGLVAALALGAGIAAPLAAAAAVLFATAPAATESVAWISGRTDLLCAFGVLATLVLQRRARGGQGRFGAAALCTGALALLSKETAVVLPALLWFDAREPRESGRDRVRAVLPVLVLVLLWIFAHGRFADAAPGTGASDPGLRWGAAALGFAHLGFLWPWAPHAALLVWSPPAQPLAFAAWAGLLAACALLAYGGYRGARWALPLALVILPLGPVCASVFLEPQARLAERSLYLPLAGVALGLAWAAVRLRIPAPWTAAALTLAALAQAQVSIPLAATWRSDETRIARIAATRPSDLDAALGLADLLGTQGRFAEAAAAIARAERANPQRAEVAVARAALLLRSGDAAGALEETQRALAIQPRQSGAALVRLRALGELGRREEAATLARELAASAPHDTRIQAALGHALLWAGRVEEARPSLERAAQAHPDDAAIAYDQGVAAARAGQAHDAEVALSRAVAIDPGLYDAWLVLANVRAGRGDRAGSEQALARAESLPGSADGRAAKLRAALSR